MYTRYNDDIWSINDERNLIKYLKNNRNMNDICIFLKKSYDSVKRQMIKMCIKIINDINLTKIKEIDPIDILTAKTIIMLYDRIR